MLKINRIFALRKPVKRTELLSPIVASQILASCGGTDSNKHSIFDTTDTELGPTFDSTDSSQQISEDIQEDSDIVLEINEDQTDHIEIVPSPKSVVYQAQIHPIADAAYDAPDDVKIPSFDQDYSENYISEYKAKAQVFDLSNNPEINSLLHGSPTNPRKTDYAWKGEGDQRILSFSFVDPELTLLDENDYDYQWDEGDQLTNYVYNSDILEFSAVQKENIRKAFHEFEKIINIKYVEVVEEGNQVGTLRIGLSAGDFQDYAAFAVQPGTYWTSSGDVWFDRHAQNESFSQGESWYFTALMHELAHAMGLKHPHETSYYNLETMSTLLDVSNYTLMSYEDPDWGWYGSGRDAIWTISHTLQLYDIQALQYLYGENTTYNTGNTHYLFQENQPFSKTLWDAGGIDLLDFSNLGSDCVIDLSPGSYSTVPFANWDPVDNLGIAFGTVIENAIGSQGNDVIYGNDGDNRISGSDGNDTIFGGAGNDILEADPGHRDGIDNLFGGLGDDVYYLSGNDICHEYSDEGNDTIFLVDVTDFQVPDNFERIFTSNASSKIYGNDLNNVFMGGEASDTFTGGGGADTFLIALGMNHDTVTDFNADEGDIIRSVGQELAYTEISTDLGFVITLDAHNSLTVYVA